MIKRLFILTLASLLLSATSLAAEMKVGIVNVQAVLSKAPQLEAESIKLQEKFKERSNVLQALQTEIKGMQEKGQKDRMTMSNEDLKALSRDIEFKSAELQLKDKSFKEDVQEGQELANRAVFQLMMKAIDQVARNEKIDVVIRRETTLYAIPGVDLTDKVITLMADPSFK